MMGCYTLDCSFWLRNIKRDKILSDSYLRKLVEKSSLYSKMEGLTKLWKGTPHALGLGRLFARVTHFTRRPHSAMAAFVIKEDMWEPGCAEHILQDFWQADEREKLRVTRDEVSQASNNTNWIFKKKTITCQLNWFQHYFPNAWVT